MNKKNSEQCQDNCDRLADILWWLRGYNATVDPMEQDFGMKHTRALLTAMDHFRNQARKFEEVGE